MNSETRSDDEHQLIRPDRGNKEPSKAAKGDWKAILSFTSTSHFTVLSPALICSLAAGIIHPAMAIFSGRFFNTFSRFGEAKLHEDEFMKQSLTSVYSLLGIGVAAWIIKGAFFCLWLLYGDLQAKSVRDTLFQALLEKDIEWYEQRPQGIESLLARLQTQIHELQVGTSQPLGFVCTSLVEAVVSMIVAFYHSWQLTLIILSAVLLTAAGLSVIGSGARKAAEAQNQALDEALKVAYNAMVNIIVVNCFNKESYETDRYRQSIFTAAAQYLKQARINALQIGFARFIATTVIAAGIFYGTTLIHQGKSTAGDILTTFWTCLGATRAFEDILPHLVALRKGSAAAFALHTALGHVEKGKVVNDTQADLCPGTLEGDIEVQNLSFAYPTRSDRLVLHDATFFFPAGETTFLVGKSGSGKSTVGSLFLKFYTAYTGRISIDGHDIRDLDTNWLRNNITLVQQQSALFDETVLQNITLQDEGSSPTSLEQVRQVLSFAILDDIIAQLPEGTGTRVGAGGSHLSGGQKQRMAIARARFRNTPILVLDESTSALDITNRVAVMRNIRAWRKGKTTIIITHDLSQIADDDFMYLLKHGRVVAGGYRQSLSEAIEDSGISEEIPVPADSNTGYNQMPTDHVREPRNRRFSFDKNDQDSIDVLLDTTAEDDALKTVRGPSSRQDFASVRNLSRRLSAHVGAVLDDIKQQHTTMPETSSSNGKTSIRMPPSQRVRRSATRSIRPMSMHQAIAMKSLYRQSQHYDRLRQDPADLSTLNQEVTPVSANSDATDEPSDRITEQFLSLRQVLMTIGPSLSRWRRFLLLSGFLAATFHAASPPLLSYLIAKLFTTFFLPTGWRHEAITLSLGILGVAFADGTACFFMHYNLEACGQTWVDGLRMQATKRILRQPKTWFDKKRNSPTLICSALDRNAEDMRNLLGRFSASIYVVTVMIMVAIIWALIKCWKLALVGMTSASVMYVITKTFNHVSSIWEVRVNEEGNTVQTIFTDTFSDINTVRALTLESYFHKKYNRATSRAFLVGVQRVLYSGAFFGLSASTVHFVTAAIFAYGAVLAKSKAYSTESILTVFSLLLFCTTNANSIVAFIPQISSSIDTASRLIRLSQLPVDSHEQIGRERLDRTKPGSTLESVRFINLTFFYPSRPQVPVLINVNLSINSGQITAIVGSSGSGKSTITSLLLGIYPPTALNSSTDINHTYHDDQPSLLVFGHDIRSLDIHSLRSLISIVPQTPTIMPGTIRDNILYGLDSSSSTISPTNLDHQLISAARSAGIHDFISSLPQGYDTPLLSGAGSTNSSTGLSGGQAQRVVIARSLIRRPRILILDEATSALDRESARIVRDAVRGLVDAGHIETVIAVTHAREMMAWADRVVVLDRGRLVEQGKFRELMRLGVDGCLWRMIHA